MIREITGMLVTATAIPNTSISAVRFSGRADEAPGAEHGDQAEPRGERQDHAESGDQADRAPRCAAVAAHLRSRREHQQQQPELIDRTERGGRGAVGREDPVLNVRGGRARAVGPSSMPPTISPIAGGCPTGRTELPRHARQ